jgi:hypothetical protein
VWEREFPGGLFDIADGVLVVLLFGTVFDHLPFLRGFPSENTDTCFHAMSLSKRVHVGISQCTSKTMVCMQPSMMIVSKGNSWSAHM